MLYHTYDTRQEKWYDWCTMLACPPLTRLLDYPKVYLSSCPSKQSLSTRSCMGTALALLSSNHCSKSNRSQTWSTRSRASVAWSPQGILRFLQRMSATSWQPTTLASWIVTKVLVNISPPLTGSFLTPATRFTVTSSFDQLVVRMKSQWGWESFGTDITLATHSKGNQTMRYRGWDQYRVGVLQWRKIV